MSTKDPNINPGADATENNLAGSRDDFNNEVTARLVQEAAADRRDEEREEQAALETDEDSPASDANPSS